MPEMTVRTEVQLNCSAEALWKYLTASEYTRQYMFGCSVESSWKEGEEVLWKDPDGKVVVQGVIQRMEPGKTLHYTTFDPNMGLKDIPENYMLVTYDIQPNQDGSLLKITQGDFGGAENAEKRYLDTVQGWDYVVAELKKLAS